MHRDLFCLLFIGNAKMAGEVPNPGASAQNRYTASLPSEKHLIGE
jgi:hypothetical protein